MAELVALIWVKKHKTNIEVSEKYQLSAIHFFLDSQLVVNQLKGKFKIKNYNLKNIQQKVKLLEQSLTVPVIYEYVPREHNREADRLVNLALDENHRLEI